MGGEKFPPCRCARDPRGSPPRGRGKATDSIDLYVTSRITPAWAGKRSTALWPGVTAWDHPRVGGEKLDFATTPVRTLGSPPRGRGKAPPVKMKPSTPRITPAWAGKRGQYRRPGRAHRDHPRVGGEKYNSSVERNHKRGSPPRGRGKVGFLPAQSLDIGITPAWAGKSISKRPGPHGAGDHPRVGGEKPPFTPGLALPPRITPAWAGKSCMSRWSRGPGGDHPRVGGEKLAFPAILARELGSPPRGRGKVMLFTLLPTGRGITPAWAGKSG